LEKIRRHSFRNIRSFLAESGDFCFSDPQEILISFLPGDGTLSPDGDDTVSGKSLITPSSFFFNVATLSPKFLYAYK